VINIEETQKMGTFKEFLENCGIGPTEEDVLGARKEFVGFTPIEISIP